MAGVPGRGRPRRVSRSRAAKSEHQGRSRESGAVRAQCRRRQQCRSVGARRNVGDDASRGRSAVQRHGAARTAISLRHPQRPQHQGGLSDGRGSQRLHSAERACRNLARYRRFVHLSRAQRALHSDQIQRPRTRSRQHGRRGATADRKERQAPDRLPHHLGRRVRGAAAGQGAAGDHRSDQPADDPGAAVRPVQFAARQPDGAGRHSVRRRRRHCWRFI